MTRKPEVTGAAWIMPGLPTIRPESVTLRRQGDVLSFYMPVQAYETKRSRRQMRWRIVLLLTIVASLFRLAW
jgi:hypothetical protein